MKNYLTTTLLVFVSLTLLLAACANNTTPTPFIILSIDKAVLSTLSPVTLSAKSLI